MNNSPLLYSFLKLKDNVDDEMLLKKIHFKRFKSKFSMECINEIEKKYIKTNDIRYFNELLWICDDKKKISKSFTKFYENYKNGKYNHNYDPNFFNLEYSRLKLNKTKLANNSVALIGNPLFFIIPYFILLKNGVRADIIHIKYHPNKLLNKIFNSFSFFYKIIFNSSYTSFKIVKKSQLYELTLSKKYDIGFHKLSFIIKDNIISCFNKGLINDHWGALPFVKGRSTLLFSKLLNFPLTVTTHLIDKVIDSGKIIKYFPLNNNFLKFQIIFGLNNRIIDSLNLLSQMKFKEIDNKSGVFFYEMNPWLKNKIK